MKKQQLTLFCIGYGYCAQQLAETLGPKTQIYATARTDEQVSQLTLQGIRPVDIRKPDLAALPQGAHWLVSAPPGEAGCPGFDAFGDAAKEAGWIGYLSTTGVYGDLDGGWAFEWSALNPQSEPGKRRAIAEAQWLSTDGPVQIFRLPGIYGPGRSAFDRLKTGKARRIIKDGQVFSRVHVEDIVSALMASMERPRTGGIYHPCDDEPGPPQDVIAYAAKLLGLPVPPDLPIESVNLSPMARRFYDECKRVSNARTKSELGWAPTYPNYRVGLSSIHALETA